MAKLGDECDYSSSSEEDNLDPRIQVKFPVLFNYFLVKCEFGILRETHSSLKQKMMNFGFDFYLSSLQEFILKVKHFSNVSQGILPLIQCDIDT